MRRHPTDPNMSWILTRKYTQTVIIFVYLIGHLHHFVRIVVSAGVTIAWTCRRTTIGGWRQLNFFRSTAFALPAAGFLLIAGSRTAGAANTQRVALDAAARRFQRVFAAAGAFFLGVGRRSTTSWSALIGAATASAVFLSGFVFFFAR